MTTRIGLVGGIFDTDDRRARSMLSAPEYRQLEALEGRFSVTTLGLNVGFRELRRNEFAAVVSNHFSKTALRAAALGLPYVYVSHDGLLARPWLRHRRPVQEYARRWIIRRARRIIALSVEEREALRRIARNSDNVVLLPNVLDVLRYKPQENVTPATDVLYVGHFTPNKGLDVLLEGISLYEQWTSSHLRVLLIGFHSPKDERWLRDMIARLQLKSDVRWRSGLPLESLVYELQRTRVYVAASHAEAQSTLLEEALSAGAYVIATRVGHSVEVLPRCRLVSAGGSQELAMRLWEWSREPDACAMEPFQPRQSLEAWKDRLRELVAEIAHA